MVGASFHIANVCGTRTAVPGSIFCSARGYVGALPTLNLMTAGRSNQTFLLSDCHSKICSLSGHSVKGILKMSALSAVLTL